MSGQMKSAVTLLACKAIALAPELSSSARQVGCAIIDHFNRQTGQCDPSISRLAHLLGLGRRTILRAVEELDRHQIIRKVRHGGGSHRNRYEPDWPRLEELEGRWRKRMKGKLALDETDKSVASTQDKSGTLAVPPPSPKPVLLNRLDSEPVVLSRGQHHLATPFGRSGPQAEGLLKKGTNT